MIRRRGEQCGMKVRRYVGMSGMSAAPLCGCLLSVLCELIKKHNFFQFFEEGGVQGCRVCG